MNWNMTKSIFWGVVIACLLSQVFSFVMRYEFFSLGELILPALVGAWIGYKVDRAVWEIKNPRNPFFGHDLDND